MATTLGQGYDNPGRQPRFPAQNRSTLAAALNSTFAARSDVIAFLTPAGRRSLAPHYDPVDVFVVQLEGTSEPGYAGSVMAQATTARPSAAP